MLSTWSTHSGNAQELATEALVAGQDTLSLTVLAGEPLRVNAPADLHELFESTLRELVLSVPALLYAARILIRHHPARLSQAHYS